MKIIIIPLVLLSLTSYAQERFYSYDENVSIIVPSGWHQNPDSTSNVVMRYLGDSDSYYVGADLQNTPRSIYNDYVHIQSNTNGISYDYVRTPLHITDHIDSLLNIAILSGDFQESGSENIIEKMDLVFANFIAAASNAVLMESSDLITTNGLMYKVYEFGFSDQNLSNTIGKNIYVLDKSSLNIFEIMYTESSSESFFESVDIQVVSSNPISYEEIDNINEGVLHTFVVNEYAEFSHHLFVPENMELEFHYNYPYESSGVIEVRPPDSPIWLPTIPFNISSEIVGQIIQGPAFVRLSQEQYQTWGAFWLRTTDRLVLSVDYDPIISVSGILSSSETVNTNDDEVNQQLADALESIDTLQTQVDLLYNQLVNPDATITNTITHITTNTITNSVGYTLSEVADMRLGSQMVSVSNSQALLRFGLDMSDDLTATWQTNAYEIEVEIPATNDVQFFRLRMD